VNENTPGSNDSSSNNPQFHQRRKLIIGIVGLLILTPLLIYTNCGNIQEGMQSELSSENGLPEGVHQKVFVDIAGEHVDGLKVEDASVQIQDKRLDLPNSRYGGICYNWVQEAYLKAPNLGSQDEFGKNVSISGERAVVGASWEDSAFSTILNGPGGSNDNLAQSAGAAYVFTRVNGLWTQEAYLKPSNMEGGDVFGASVSISGDRIAVISAAEDSDQG
jgi:hypothetical protein